MSTPNSTVRPAAATDPLSDNEIAARLLAANKKQQELDRVCARLEAESSHLTKQYEEARAEAKRLYGTDDLKALRELLVKAREEGTRALLAYEKSLESLEQVLQSIDGPDSGMAP